MRRFVLKTSIFLASIFVIAVIYVIYYLTTFQSINNKSSEDAIFIWGDSQAEAGFDLVKIRQITNKKVYTAARGGAGAYDFLVFAEIVPRNSKVYLSISQLALIRGRDKSNSGIPFKSLPLLIIYKYNHLLSILRQNIKPKSLFATSTELYPYSDTITFHEPLSKFEEIYTQNPDQVDIKEKLFIAGIKRLVEKGCKLTFVEFPFNPRLRTILRNSPVRNDIRNFTQEMLDIFSSSKFDSIEINTPKRMMYDLSHLNEYGAAEVTEKIFNINFQSPDSITRYFVINGGISE